MKVDKISLEIAALKKQLKTVDNDLIKSSIEKKISRLEADLKGSNLSGVELARKLLAGKKSINNMSSIEFKEFIRQLSKKPEYSFLKSLSRQQVKDDFDRIAKPVGWRFRGRTNFAKPTRTDIKLKRNVYYENRSNRADVSTVVKLARGGGLDYQEKSVYPNNKFPIYEMNERYKEETLERLEELFFKNIDKDSRETYYNQMLRLQTNNGEKTYYALGYDTKHKGNLMKLGEANQTAELVHKKLGKKYDIAIVEIPNFTTKNPMQTFEYVVMTSPMLKESEIESLNIKYAKGGSLSDDEYTQKAVNFMNYNGLADIVSDGKGGWLVSNLNEDEDYKNVKYDSQGVVYLALNHGFDNNSDDDYDDDDDDDYAKGGEIEHSTFKYYKIPNENLWAIQECNNSYADEYGTSCVVIRTKKSESEAIKEVERLNSMGMHDYYAKGGGVDVLLEKGKVYNIKDFDEGFLKENDNLVKLINNEWDGKFEVYDENHIYLNKNHYIINKPGLTNPSRGQLLEKDIVKFANKNSKKSKTKTEINAKPTHTINCNVYYIDSYEDFNQEAVPEYELDGYDIDEILENDDNYLYIEKGEKGFYNPKTKDFETENGSNTRLDKKYCTEIKFNKTKLGKGGEIGGWE